VVDVMVAAPEVTRPPVGKAFVSGAATALPHPIAAKAAIAIIALTGR
jgi:hypothetical protein